VANGRVLREAGYDNVWIQPASGDAGGALGAAQFVWYQLLENERKPVQPDGQAGSYLGPEFDDGEIGKFLAESGASYRHCGSEEELCAVVADSLAAEKVVGWFQGRMEFGPRALGARSILGDARSTSMQRVMNVKIKFRESFRPFAPSVLRERAADYFEVEGDLDSPYMLMVAGVQSAQRLGDSAELDRARGFDKLRVERSRIQAVTHVDCSARVQTVDPQRHRLYHRLISSFEERTGCPVVINTSFNVRGEPVVCTPEDAFRCFMATDMDVLAMGGYVLEKENQPASLKRDIKEHIADFALD
jgi:carbamoyltransferase